MLLKQNASTGYWTDTQCQNLVLVGVHTILVCRNPCPIHNTASDHNLSKEPLYFDENRGILLRECTHGIKHPDYDSARYYYTVNLQNMNVHVCDGCCGL